MQLHVCEIHSLHGAGWKDHVQANTSNILTKYLISKKASMEFKTVSWKHLKIYLKYISDLKYVKKKKIDSPLNMSVLMKSVLQWWQL